MENGSYFENLVITLGEMIKNGEGTLNVNSPYNLEFILNEEYLKKTLNIDGEELTKTKSIIDRYVYSLIIATLLKEEEDYISFRIKDLEKEKRKKMIQEIKKDFKVVKKHLINEKLAQDYLFKIRLKEITMNSLEWSINKKVYDSSYGDDVGNNYVTINLKLNDAGVKNVKLPSFFYEVFNLEPTKTVNFTCTKRDIEYLITMLRGISKELERGEKNG